MIRNSSSELVDVFTIQARPEPRLNESSSTLLNGGWFVQTIGEPSEVIKMRVVCRWDVVQEIMGYYKTKERLTVTFLDFEKTGFILSPPSYDIGERDEVNPKYIVTLELAVVPNV